MTEFEEKLAETSGVVQEQAGARLDACLRLRDFAVGLHKPWSGRPLDEAGHPEDLLIVSLFVRTLATYSAALELARMGYTPQTAMLNRSLFEDMIDLHWIHAEPAVAVQRVAEHHEHAKMLLADVVAKYPAWYSDIPIPEFDADQRKVLDRVFGRHGHKSWTGLSLHDRVDAVIGQWDDGQDQASLRFMYDIPHRESNQTLHVSASSLSDLVQSNGPDGLVLRFGPDTDMLIRAVTNMHWTFVQSVALLLDHFGFEITEQERDQAFSVVDFVVLTPEQMRNTDRNDPCPCESGKKFKRCHGA